MKRLRLKAPAPGCTLSALIDDSQRVIHYERTNPSGHMKTFASYHAALKDSRQWYGKHTKQDK